MSLSKQSKAENSKNLQPNFTIKQGWILEAEHKKSEFFTIR